MRIGVGPDSNFRRTASLSAAAAALILGMAACSSDDEASPSASPSNEASGSPTASATASSQPSASAVSNATVEFNREVQSKLNAVGCHAGAVDGVLGPETDAAILKFQEAQGLATDGELGPQTEAALDSAAAAGETVCTQQASTPSPSVTHSQGVACSADSLRAVTERNEDIVSFICADFLDDRIAAGKVQRGADEYSFYARVEGDSWVRMDANFVCQDIGAALPPDIAQYCSDGE